jgi:hypothetical protein
MFNNIGNSYPFPSFSYPMAGFYPTPSPATMPVNNTDSFTRFGQKPSEPVKEPFSIKRALKNYGQGLISPITAPISMMRESTKNFLIGAGLLATGITGIILYGTVLAPYLTVIGLGIGAFQAAKGLSSLIKAKDNKAREQAFKEFGASTASFGLSALTLGSLKKFFPTGTTVAKDSPPSNLAKIGQVSLLHEPLHLAPMASMANSKQTNTKPSS